MVGRAQPGAPGAPVPASRAGGKFARTTRAGAAGASYRTLLRVGGPVLLGSLTQSVVYLTDSLFVGRLGEAALAAVGLGGLIFYFLTTVGAGLATGMQLLVARRLAERRPRTARQLFGAAGYLTGGLAVGLGLALWGLAPWLARTLGPAEAAVPAALVGYLRVVAGALPPSFAYLWLTALYTGTGRPNLIPVSTLALAGANVLGNVVWTWGYLGGPALGLTGAAWAAILSESVGVLVLLGGLLWPGHASLAGWLRPQWWSAAPARQLLRFAGPLVLRQLVEVSGWLGFFALVAGLGPRALAASNIVRSLYTFASLPALALGAALHTLVSRAVGRGQPGAVLPTVGRATVLALALSALPALALLLAPRQLAGLFTTEPALLAACAPVLRLLALLLLTFAACTLLYQTVVGVGGTGRSLLLEVAGTGFYLLATALAVHLAHWPLAAVWAVEMGYWLLLGALSWQYLNSSEQLTVSS